MSSILSLLVLSGLFGLGAPLAAAVNVSVPLSLPGNSQPLSPTLVSFSIEQDRWPEWVGIDTRNDFTHDALLRLASFTGVPPKIRVGADSEDHTFWSPTMAVSEAEFSPPSTIIPYPEATKVTVGDKYYTLSHWLPRGTHMTWGVNLGADNATNAVNMAKAIVRAFKSTVVKASGVVLDYIEVGNEADLFSRNGLRPSNWTVEEYVPDWIAIAGAAADAAGIRGKHGPVSLQGAAFAQQQFTPRAIYDLGILDSKPGKAVSIISQHQYSAAFCNGGDFPLTSFMSKAHVRGNLSLFIPDIEATHARGLPYILGETNSIACHGAPGVSNTAGAALWAIDYTLQAATLSIAEVFYHEGIGYKYNFLQPVALNRSIVDGSALDTPLPPHIQPIFYGAMAVNALIGRSGHARVVELDVGDDNVAGYAAYEDGRLVRAVFVNLHAWLASSTGARPSVHIDLGVGLGAGAVEDAFWRGGGKARAKRLVVGHADDTEGLTWAGQSYEKSGDVSPTGRMVDEEVVLSKGLDLRSTEAVLLLF
ncbi:glycoside hydrolase family 79 protein [Epithele typhae]|uniref:glycoside hydrolase family 79 protein n=1 Tax=Epithele typhae TaxID=378194 RepID=UPI0020080755|nr:glycoside hydrolase family 79 protein [Epithele typhae]KAH9941692.1 glycoside hydrolase family 79 protein [Epithele typhae]